MGFDVAGLSPAGSQSKRGKAPQQWTYKTADAVSSVKASGYFSASYARLFSVGDLIDVIVVDDMTSPTQVRETGSLVVANITSAAVMTVIDVSNAAYGKRYVRMPFFFNETDLLAGTSQYTLSPVAGTIKRIVTCVKKQVTTGGAIGLSLAGSAVAGLSITVADAAAVGTVQSATPTAVQRVTEDQAIAITAAAAFATAGEVFGFVEIIPDVDTGDIHIPFFINATDLSAGTSQYWPCPVAGQIIKAGSVVQTAIVTGGAITFELANVAVVGLSITVADASAVGDVDTDTPTDLAGATGAIAREGVLEVVPASAFNGGGAVNGYVTVRPTYQTDSSFVWFSANQTDVLAGTSHYVASPVRGNIKRAVTATQVAVGTGGNVTFEQSNVAVLGLTVVVANSAAVGDMDRDDVTSLFDVTCEINDAAALEVVFDAAFATTGALNGVVEIVPARP